MNKDDLLIIGLGILMVTIIIALFWFFGFTKLGLSILIIPSIILTSYLLINGNPFMVSDRKKAKKIYRYSLYTEKLKASNAKYKNTEIDKEDPPEDYYSQENMNKDILNDPEIAPMIKKGTFLGLFFVMIIPFSFLMLAIKGIYPFLNVISLFTLLGYPVYKTIKEKKWKENDDSIPEKNKYEGKTENEIYEDIIKKSKELTIQKTMSKASYALYVFVLFFSLIKLL